VVALLREQRTGKKVALPVTAIGEGGRFRHTIRLEPKVEQKFRAVAEILGIDPNAAIAVCVSAHHQCLTMTSNED